MSTARQLAVALGGRWYSNYGTARCPAHDDRSPSLSIRDGEAGVLLRCHAGCDAREIIACLHARGLWQAQGEQTRFSAGSIFSFAPARHHDDGGRIEAGLRIWREARPLTGSPVETYLRDARGVWTGTAPADMGFAPDLSHASGGRYPAMVCAVRQADGTISGVHRTWLRPDGSGKAEVTPQKAMLGRCAGGAVRLARAGEAVQVAEGIETALAVLTATGVPTWAALSTSGIRALVLPPEVRCVTLCADGDDAGEAAAQAAAQRWLAEGRSVRIARPPRGTDFADMMLAGSFAVGRAA